MRSAEDVLARARVLNLVGSLAKGTPIELLRPELHRHALGIHLTPQEARWFWEDAEIEASESAHFEAMLALAWVLRITPSIDSTLGEVQDALDDTTFDVSSLREESAVRAMLATLERLWHRRALRWALDESVEWPFTD